MGTTGHSGGGVKNFAQLYCASAGKVNFPYYFVPEHVSAWPPYFKASVGEGTTNHECKANAHLSKARNFALGNKRWGHDGGRGCYFADRHGQAAHARSHREARAGTREVRRVA